MQNLPPSGPHAPPTSPSPPAEPHLAAATPERVAAALRRVDRRRFTADDGHGLIAGRSIPTREAVAGLVHAAEVGAADRVLHVGAGAGYVAAVLAELAAEVVAVERVPGLAQIARARLDAAASAPVRVLAGDGLDAAAIVEQAGAFDVVIVTCRAAGAADAASGALRGWLALLRPGARLVHVRTRAGGRGVLVVHRRRADGELELREAGPIDLEGDLAERLVDMGVIAPEVIAEVRREAAAAGAPVLEVLQRRHALDERDLFRATAEQHQLGFASLGELLARIDPRLFERVPRAFLDHHRVLPVCERGGAVEVATPRTDGAVDDLAMVFPGRALMPVLVTPTDFRRLWAALELQQARGGEREGAGPQAAVGPAEQDLLRATTDDPEAHAIALFEALLLDAIGERASDIHLERYGERVRVRLRVDGELRDVPRYRLQPAELRGVVNVIKIRANLDIAERRLPQGGRIRQRAGGQAFDLRVQTQPALDGEHVVIRLLPQDTKLLTIEELGFQPELARTYRRLLDSPAGLILVVGPTGSGKSTTLYAGLQVLARDARRKVITAEDPIEYSIEGVQQTQIRPEIGFRFDGAMRAFVRQDPDVILVGEIRDAETALEAIRASQTGHVVLSTLHCNDAVDAVQRLYDLGMHPNSIASELLAVLAQRLAKRICPACREPTAPEPELLAELFPPELVPEGPPPDFRCFVGRGCRHCGGRGTRGRVAVIESLRAGAAVRRAIARQPALDDLRAVALRSGLATLRDNALAHVMAGTIPLAELPRLLPAERMAPEGVEPAA